MNTLSLNGVNKHYVSKHALVDFDYDFHDGVYGLLGPNGAGKSTMMNLITQNIPADPDSEILWNGEDINKLQAKYRKRIGFMPQQQELYPSFTASRFVGYLAALKGIKKEKIESEVERVLDLVELSEQADQKLGGLPVLGYLILLTVYRIISLTIFAELVLLISYKCKSPTTATIITLAAFALPIVIYLAGADFMQWLCWRVSGNREMIG